MLEDFQAKLDAGLIAAAGDGAAVPVGTGSVAGRGLQVGVLQRAVTAAFVAFGLALSFVHIVRTAAQATECKDMVGETVWAAVPFPIYYSDKGYFAPLECRWDKVTHLEIRDQELASLPAEALRFFVNLEVLDVSGNELTEFDPRILVGK